MGVPLIQSYKVGRYIVSQKLRGRKRYPLVLMLEPLFRCNLACAGCGKIDYPDDVLDKRLSVEECIGAANGHHKQQSVSRFPSDIMRATVSG